MSASQTRDQLQPEPSYQPCMQTLITAGVDLDGEIYVAYVRGPPGKRAKHSDGLHTRAMWRPLFGHVPEHCL